MIPVSEPWLEQRELDLVMEALKSGWISGAGPYVERFEAKWADVCRRKAGVAVSSGTAALETAVHALDLPKGSEVVLPTFTMIACVAAVLRNGLVPVFVDADPVSWCLDVGRVEEAITPRTSAIMAVHIYGHPVDMPVLAELAGKRGLRLIEDAAEAHGALCHDRICGSFGDVSTFSFYGNKIVTSGEGGMVVCDDPVIAERCRCYRNMGFSPKHRFEHTILGQSFRLTNLQAALGCVQADKLPESLVRKWHMADLYQERLRGIADLQLPDEPAWGTNVYWVYGLVLGERHGIDAAEFQRRLKEAGVDSRPFFLGMHEQPVVRDAGYGKGQSFPVAERLARRGLYIPSGLAITDDQIERTAAAIRALLAGSASP